MASTTRIGSCPRCGRSVPLVQDNPWRPFCSERCKAIDFGGWVTEQYRIPGAPEADRPAQEETQD